MIISGGNDKYIFKVVLFSILSQLLLVFDFILLLDLGGSFFSHAREVFDHNLFKYILGSFLSLSLCLSVSLSLSVSFSLSLSPQEEKEERGIQSQTTPGSWEH